jgi:hypothetical protein
MRFLKIKISAINLVTSLEKITGITQKKQDKKLQKEIPNLTPNKEKRIYHSQNKNP